MTSWRLNPRWIAALVLGWGAAAWGQAFSILDARLDAGRRANLEVEAAAGAYYILFRGPTATQVQTPATVEFGGNEPVFLIDPQPIPVAGERFYRVQRLPATSPRDLDGDGIDDVYELGLRPALNPLDPDDAARDTDGDGLSNRDEYLQGTDPLTPNTGGVTTFVSSPDQLETGVSVQRETIFHFNRPLAPGTAINGEALNAESNGRRLLGRIEISSDLRKVTLFPLEPLPGAARVRVRFDGNAVRDAQGRAVDADGDGRPGGVGIVEFDTFGNQGLENTGVVGRVLASELAPGGAGGPMDRPLEGVIVTVDGAEETLRATTDAEGRFTLKPAPPGRLFVHIDGRRARGSSWPDGSYYPVVGKA